jgi:hypothetical protein
MGIVYPLRTIRGVVCILLTKSDSQLSIEFQL